MSADISRRDFLVSLAAAAVLPSAAVALPGASAVDATVDMTRSMIRRGSFASSILPPFEDLRPDRYYDLQGGPYKDTGGTGGPYDYMGSLLLHDFALLADLPDFEERLERIASRGFYLSVSTYFGQPYRSCGRIHLTKSWIKEFYRRHMHDTDEDWHRRYTECRDALIASGWKPEYDRMSREELVAIGWKGVDIYRKDG